MSHLRRILSAFMLGSGMMLAMTAMSAPPPAEAAGLVYYVNDTASNDPTPSPCPRIDYNDLQTLVTALDTAGTKSNITIYVCPGLYPISTNIVTFNGYTNLKVMGKGYGAVMWAGGLNTALISVLSSTKVTISNLGFYGNGMLGNARATAIQFVNSTGTISKNLIAGWHQDYDHPLTSSGVGIEIDSVTAAQKVVVDHNTLLEVQSYGILTFGPGKTSITHNQIRMRNNISVPASMPPAPRAQAGIMLVEAGPGVSVSRNQIDGNTGIEPMCGLTCDILPNDSRGIMLLQTSGAAIKSNKVNYLQYGISVESWCANIVSTPGEELANGNTISGNLLHDDGYAVYIFAENFFGTGCVAQANNNKISGNKLYHDVYNTSRVQLEATLPAMADGNRVTGNSFYGNALTADLVGVNGTGVTGLVETGNKRLPTLMGAP